MNEYLRWACGALTDGIMVVSTEASDFMRMWIDPYPDDEPGRLAARHGFLTRPARTLQDGLVEAAIAAGDYSSNERQAELIAWPKDRFPYVPAYGMKPVPLFLVRPVERVRAGPEADGILVVDPRSEVKTTRGLIAMGWLEGAGIVNSAASVRDPHWGQWEFLGVAATPVYSTPATAGTITEQQHVRKPAAISF